MTYIPLPKDDISGAAMTIEFSHHEVHEGDMYAVGIYDEDAASGDTVEIQFKTPAVTVPQKRVHMVFEHSSTGEHLMEITEGAIYQSGGTAKTPINRNRGSLNTSSMQHLYTGSDKGADNVVTAGGTIIEDIWTGSGRGTGGSSRSLEEWVLAPNTEYLFQMTSKAAGIALHVRAVWYEHTDTA